MIACALCMCESMIKIAFPDDKVISKNEKLENVGRHVHVVAISAEADGKLRKKNKMIEKYIFFESNYK